MSSPQKILRFRQTARKKQFLVKWKDQKTPTWQVKSKTIEPLIQTYNKIMSGKMEYTPIDIRKRNPHVQVVLRDRLAVCIDKEIIQDTDNIPMKMRESVLNEFEGLFGSLLIQKKGDY